MNQNYQELANAIIIQASHDYIVYYKVLKKLKLVNTGRLNNIQKRKLEKKITVAKAGLDEVRSFFCSEWIKQLTNLAPKSILNKLELEAEAYGHVVEEGHKVVTGGSTVSRNGRKLNVLQRGIRGISVGGKTKAEKMIESTVKELNSAFGKNAEKLLDDLIREVEL